jgi:hypothetical protein
VKSMYVSQLTKENTHSTDGGKHGTNEGKFGTGHSSRLERS